MDLITACKNILEQLSHALEQISSDDFVKPSKALSNATVGQHVRHTLEFFICLEDGFEQGVVNYDKRSRDEKIEKDKAAALSTIGRIFDFVDGRKSDKKLFLEVSYDRNDDTFVTIDTNYLRELTYNIEHAVHHMAIMKIGIREVAPYVMFSPDFGIAVSTLRHKETSPMASR